MALYELLSENEVSMMNKWIDTYAGAGSNRSASLSHILRYWEQNKNKYLYKLLGDSLTYTFPIEYTKTDEEIIREIEDAWGNQDSKLYRFGKFLDELDNALWYLRHYPQAIDLHCKNSKISQYIKDYGCFYNNSPNTDYNRISSGIGHLRSNDSLVSNIYDGPNFELYNPVTENYFRIQTGMKTLKALRKIAKLFDCSVDFEAFCEGLTSFWYVTTISSEITLSIHPMDYMTMSDTNNWSSCMNWQDNGDYRRGTVEMMNSEMVVVAYIANKDNHLYFNYNPVYTWNDKIWRELFIVTPQVISGVKGYQFWNHSIEETVIRKLQELAAKNLDWHYFDEMVTYNPTSKFYFKSLDRNFFIEYYTDAMYNDMIYDYHRCILSTNFANNNEVKVYIDYSGPAVCMDCGKVITSDDYSHDDGDEYYLICPECGGLHKCEICGRWEYAENMYWTNRGYVCECCYDDLHFCKICEDPIMYPDEAYEIHLAYNGQIFKWNTADIHEDCLDNKYFSAKQVHVQKTKDHWGFTRVVHYVNYEDLNDADAAMRFVWDIYSLNENIPKYNIIPENDSLLF